MGRKAVNFLSIRQESYAFPVPFTVSDVTVLEFSRVVILTK